MAKRNPATVARDQLQQAIDSACVARGEALWTNGYRTGAMGRLDSLEDKRLYQKELNRHEQCFVAEKRVQRAIAVYARAIRAAGRT